MYELKIPFSYIDQNSAIDALETSETIGIGFTIPEIDIQKLRGEMAERRGEMGGMRPGGSRSGGGMGGPGRRPRGGRGEMGERTAQDNKSLDIWIKVNLAKSQ